MFYFDSNATIPLQCAALVFVVERLCWQDGVCLTVPWDHNNIYHRLFVNPLINIHINTNEHKFDEIICKKYTNKVKVLKLKFVRCILVYTYMHLKIICTYTKIWYINCFVFVLLSSQCKPINAEMDVVFE